MDIHLHVPGELGALQIRMIAERTRALGLAGKVSVSHAFCLGMVDEAELNHLVERALLLAYRSGFRTDDLLHAALDTVTRGGADVLGLDGYGLDVGDRADF